MLEDIQRDPLIHMLDEEGFLSDDQIAILPETIERTGLTIRAAIIDAGFIDEEDLLEIIAGFLGTRVVNVMAIDPSPDVCRSVPVSVARVYEHDLCGYGHSAHQQAHPDDMVRKPPGKDALFWMTGRLLHYSFFGRFHCKGKSRQPVGDEVYP